MRHVIVGTAGHIDHGKSALVRALTGVDPDRLKEEQERGITIDLGFAHLNLGDVQIGFVDVPGHEKFIKNMLAGIGGIDCVLLVVAGDESIMPQTREHFDICRLLGIRHGIVVITKTDLIEIDLLDLVRDEIAETVAGSFLEGADVIPISSKTSAGLETLKQKLRALALSIQERPSNQIPRLPVDRAFTMRGFGTVVTGTMISGRIGKDEEVELIPGGLAAKVRGLQVHGKSVDTAFAGQRTAVNLQGIDLADVHRGMSLTAPRLFRTSQVMDVRLDMLPSARPLRNLVKVRFHQGTSEVLARVALLGQQTLDPGQSAVAQLRLESPAFCLHGDAFILRQFSPAVTIGGGRILDPQALKHKSTDRQAARLLAGLESGNIADIIPAIIRLRPRGWMDMRELNAALGMAETELMRTCTAAANAGTLIIVPGKSPSLVLPEVLTGLEKESLALVAAFHQENPLLRGISREELRKRAFDGFPPDLFRFCLEKLQGDRRLALQEDLVSLHGREVQLSQSGIQIKESIESLLREASWHPPSLQELTDRISGDPAEVRKICFWMLKERILIRIAEDFVVHCDTVRQMKEKIRARYPSGSKFGVAEFKELFDLTRKHAIPLLEFLDREHFTRRQGNDRILG